MSRVSPVLPSLLFSSLLFSSLLFSSLLFSAHRSPCLGWRTSRPRLNTSASEARPSISAVVPSTPSPRKEVTKYSSNCFPKREERVGQQEETRSFVTTEAATPDSDRDEYVAVFLSSQQRRYTLGYFLGTIQRFCWNTRRTRYCTVLYCTVLYCTPPPSLVDAPPCPLSYSIYI